MKMIGKPISKSIFPWPRKNSTRYIQYVEWRVNRNDPLILFHPDLSFYPIPDRDRMLNMIVSNHVSSLFEDPQENRLQRRYLPRAYLETPIVHEVIFAEAPFFKTVEAFLGSVESAFDPDSQGWLWADTGYWVASLGRECFYGVGTVTALNVWKIKKPDRLCYVVSNRWQLLCFTIEREQFDGFTIDAYYSNQLFAFPDLIHTIHNAADQTMKWHRESISRDNYDTVNKNGSLTAYLSDFVRKGSFEITPKWVITDADENFHPSEPYDAVVFRRNVPGNELARRSPEHFVVAQLRGGVWFDSNFEKSNRYFICGIEQRVLRTCIVADVVVESVVQPD